MHKRIIIIYLSMALQVFFFQGKSFALDCPKAPDQINKDWEIEVTAAIAKIGPVKGGELKTKTKNATQDLLGKLPDAGRIYLEQMMYSAYCTALRDDKTIKESEKAKLLKEYNREVRKTITNFSAPVSSEKGKGLNSKLQPKDETKSPPSSMIASNQTQPKTLRDLFKSEFPHLYKQSETRSVMTETNEQISIESQAYLDFESQTIFIGYYIPSTSATYSICRQLADDYNTVLELRKRSSAEATKLGLQPVNSSELKFSGRVFLYHQYPLLEEQKRKLFYLYETKGLSPQFRDASYAQRFLREQPLSISANVTLSGVSAKVEDGQVTVRATNNAKERVYQNQTVQVFGDKLSIYVQTIKLAAEDASRLTVYATISAPGEKSKNFSSVETGTCETYAGYAIRVVSISADSADFFVSDEKPCE